MCNASCACAVVLLFHQTAARNEQQEVEDGLNALMALAPGGVDPSSSLARTGIHFTVFACTHMNTHDHGHTCNPHSHAHTHHVLAS
jgi:hypothetical protein